MVVRAWVSKSGLIVTQLVTRASSSKRLVLEQRLKHRGLEELEFPDAPVGV